LSDFYHYLTKYRPNTQTWATGLLLLILAGSSTVCVSQQAAVVTDTVPKPQRVWVKSAVIPGWGQVVNKQAWKVPVIYGALGGITWFAINQHQSYIDYRAAYYNTIPGRNDFQYGPTRPDLEGLPPEQLRFNRNSYRNRRDLSIIVFVAAWGLNAIDAYVFAHLRDFDTGPDLSITPSVYKHPFVENTVAATEIKMTIPLSVRK
jgi:hypothetical protein